MTEQSPAQRRTARIAGVLFVLTFITAIAGLVLYDPVLNDSDYILGAGEDTQIRFGALFEILLMVTNIGAAVVLFPILRRPSKPPRRPAGPTNTLLLTGSLALNALR